MRYAVSNWIYGDEPLSDTFSRLSSLGYHGIELVGEPTRYNIAEIKTLCEEYGIAITSVLGWCIWGIPGRDVCSPNGVEREAALTYGKACIDLASAVGAPIFVVLPAPAGRTAPSGMPKSEGQWDVGYRIEWYLAIDSVSKLAEYAAECNVTLGLEPINRYETFLITNIDQALQFITDVGSENLKLHLDTFHMNIEEPNLADAIRRARKELNQLGGQAAVKAQKELNKLNRSIKQLQGPTKKSSILFSRFTQGIAFDFPAKRCMPPKFGRA